jgi:haloalkane dehalogenase
MIHRAYLEVNGRLVHFRHAGAGAPILLIHQSPKSSAEFETLITTWSATNLVIAPDTPGFGQSDRLSNETAEVTDFARALLAFLDALGIPRIAVYGFHSGAVFAVEAAKLAPEKFTCVVCNGYAVWTQDEIQAFGAQYLPPFVPQPYGDHLTWLWARMREQRFFFPWYATSDAHRMHLPEASAAHLHGTTMDMLYAGDAYRVGYGAVVRAKRDLPADAIAIPTLIVSFDGDPLKAHLDRLGALPAKWHISACASQADTEIAAKTFLDLHAAPVIGLDILPDTARQFIDDMHICRRGAMRTLLLHAPGSSGTAMLAGFCGTDAFAIDLPGHGLTGIKYVSLDTTANLIVSMLKKRGVQPVEIIVDNLALPLAMMLIGLLTPEPALQVIHYRQYPLPALAALRESYLTDVVPDTQGTYLLAAWRRVRDSCFFDPWFDNGPDAIKPVDEAALAIEQLAAAHLAAVQATGGPAMLNDILTLFEKEIQNGNS